MGKGFTIIEYPDQPPVITWEPSPVLNQLIAADLLPFLVPLESTPHSFRGVAAVPELLEHLERHPQFASGALHGLHRDVGKHRRDFRSFTGSLGDGSLQVVVDAVTGNFYADIDRHNPYEDVVNFGGHSGEVLWPRLKKIGGWFRRLF